MEKPHLMRPLHNDHKRMLTLLPLVTSVWFWISMTIAHFVYPDPVTPDLGLSYFGLWTTPSAHDNTIGAIIFLITFIFLAVSFLIIGITVLRSNPTIGILHVACAVGLTCVAFPFDVYPDVHNTGALLVYVLFVGIAIIYTLQSTKQAMIPKWMMGVEIGITVGITGILSLLTYIGFGTAPSIIAIGGILQKVFAYLFFMVYAMAMPCLTDRCDPAFFFH